MSRSSSFNGGKGPGVATRGARFALAVMLLSAALAAVAPPARAISPVLGDETWEILHQLRPPTVNTLETTANCAVGTNAGASLTSDVYSIWFGVGKSTTTVTLKLGAGSNVNAGTFGVVGGIVVVTNNGATGFSPVLVDSGTGLPGWWALVQFQGTGGDKPALICSDATDNFQKGWKCPDGLTSPMPSATYNFDDPCTIGDSGDGAAGWALSIGAPSTGSASHPVAYIFGASNQPTRLSAASIRSQELSPNSYQKTQTAFSGQLNSQYTPVPGGSSGNQDGSGGNAYQSFTTPVGGFNLAAVKFQAALSANMAGFATAAVSIYSSTTFSGANEVINLTGQIKVTNAAGCSNVDVWTWSYLAASITSGNSCFTTQSVTLTKNGVAQTPAAVTLASSTTYYVRYWMQNANSPTFSMKPSAASAGTGFAGTTFGFNNACQFCGDTQTSTADVIPKLDLQSQAALTTVAYAASITPAAIGGEYTFYANETTPTATPHARDLWTVSATWTFNGAVAHEPVRFGARAGGNNMFVRNGTTGASTWTFQEVSIGQSPFTPWNSTASLYVNFTFSNMSSQNVVSLDWLNIFTVASTGTHHHVASYNVTGPGTFPTLNFVTLYSPANNAISYNGQVLTCGGTGLTACASSSLPAIAFANVFMQAPGTANLSYVADANGFWRDTQSIFLGKLVTITVAKTGWATTSWQVQFPNFATSLQLVVAAPQLQSKITITAKTCLGNLTISEGCDKPGPVVVNATVVERIANSGRVVTGATDTRGNFSITGTDFQGSFVTINLSAPNYGTEQTTENIPQGFGVYNFTLWMTYSPNGLPSATASAVVTFSGNFTRIVPDRVFANITKNRGVDFYVQAFRLDTSSGTFSGIGTPTLWPAATATFSFAFPDLRASQARDVGGYALEVFTASGNSTASKTFCIVSAWSAVGATLPAPLSTSTQGQVAHAGAVSVANSQAAIQTAATAATEQSTEAFYLSFLSFLFAPLLPGVNGTQPLFLIFLSGILLFAIGIANPRGR